MSCGHIWIWGVKFGSKEIMIIEWSKSKSYNLSINLLCIITCNKVNILLYYTSGFSSNILQTVQKDHLWEFNVCVEVAAY